MFVYVLWFSACSIREFNDSSIPHTAQQVDQVPVADDNLVLPTYSVGMLDKCNLAFSKKGWEACFADVHSFETYGTTQRCFIDAAIYWCLEVEKLNFTDDTNHQLKLINLFSSAVPYIKDILDADFFDALLPKDRVKLVGLFCRLNLGIACAHLRILTNNDCPLDGRLTSQYVHGYKEAKKQLKIRLGLDTESIQASFRKDLSKIYMMASNRCPYIRAFFEPPIRKKLNQTRQTRKKPSPNMLEAKRKSRNKKYREIAEEVVSSTTMDPVDIFLNAEMVFIKNMDNKSEPIDWEKMANRFLHLEASAYQMVAYQEPSLLKPDKNIADFTIEEWNKLYTGIRTHAPRTNIYGFTRMGITIYIKSNRFDLAKIRLRAIEHFYATHVNLLPSELEKDFRIFKAMSYALLGEYDELTKLYQSLIAKKVAYKNKLREKHQAKIAQLKYLQQVQLQQASHKPTSIIIEKESTLPINERDVANQDVANQKVCSEAFYKEQQQQKKEEAAEREKRHQKAAHQRKQKNILLLKEERQQVPDKVSPIQKLVQKPASKLANTNMDTSETTSMLLFSLPRKAYETIDKIFNGNWNIKRDDIEHMFDELGQEINKSTKSSHHIIKIPQAITLVDDKQQIIGIITNLSAQGAGHLTLPDWGKKVPKYMQKQILNLLQLIGINQENYVKAHREETTQVIPQQPQHDRSAVTKDIARKQNHKLTNSKQYKKVAN